MAVSLVALARGRARGHGRVAIILAVMLWVAVGASCSSGPTTPRNNPGSTGSVSGFVRYDSGGGGFGGVGVEVKPSVSGLVAEPSSMAVTTAFDGSYTVSNVPPGDGVVVVEIPAASLVPTGYCTAPAPVSFGGLKAGGMVTVNIAVYCAPSPWDY
jgi:hypothetical protein